MIEAIELESLQLPASVTAADAAAERPGSRPSQVWGGSLRLERGGRYLLRAASGTGKSSLCDFLFGNRTDYRGRILFDSTDIRSLTPRRWTLLRRSSLAYMPQEPIFFPRLTVIENIQVKNSLTRFRSPKWIDDALEALDVADKRDWPIERISVGQRQRVAAVRSLCQPFDFMLLDEPVSHLDPERSQRLATLVDTAARAQGAALIVTTVGTDLPLTYANELHL